MTRITKRLIVDPPGGYMYDYLKELLPNKDYKQLLLKLGYPKKDIKLALEYSRMW
jgi:hypothetical protein